MTDGSDDKERSPSEIGWADSCGSVISIAEISHINEFVPLLDGDRLAPFELDDDEWLILEKALQRTLDGGLRQGVCAAIGFFIHSLRLKGQILTSRQYRNQLEIALRNISNTAENLHAMIAPRTPPPSGTEYLSAKDFKSLGEESDWNAAAKASATIPEDGEVLLPEDHARLLLAANYADEVSAISGATFGLLRALDAVRKKIAEQPRNKAGADGYYELDILFVDLLAAAQAAGDNLDLPSHDIRDTVMRGTVTKHPAYLFVTSIVELVLKDAPKLVANVKPPAEDQTKLLALLKDYLDKRPGKHIERLERARTVIEGGPRG